MSNFLTLAPAASARLSANLSPAPRAGPLAPARVSLTGALSRDQQISELSRIGSSVNQLRQAAAAAVTGEVASDADAPLISLPALPPMPTPAKAPGPTDDHGKSNIVFTDTDRDAAFIH